MLETINPQKIIMQWYRANKARFLFMPWRRTHDPYYIVVSEVMLQQTQISRVVPKFEQWTEVFPTVDALAAVPFSKVLSLWQGLGYNRRAKYLHESAKIISEKYGGKIPHDPKILETLPGIGHYTARAVACFAYGKCEPFLDTNIRRVAIHFIKPRGKMRDEKVIEWLQKHSPASNQREWYYALMDYGREVFGGKKDNPNRKSAHYQKQSKFIGSRRYVRARIVDYLIAKKSPATFIQIKNELKKDFHCIRALFKHSLKDILRDLVRDGILSYQEKLWKIS